MKGRFARQWLVGGVIVCLAACQSALASPAASLTATPTLLSPSAPAPAAEASPTAIALPASTPQATHAPVGGVASPAPDPLRFVFPTPGAAPVSAWRPPLYPIPWSPTPFDHFYLARPIAANEINWPLADYRYGGIFFENAIHTGVDIPAPIGTPVLAAGGGRVIWAGYGIYRGGNDPSDPYGLAVVIRHDFGYEGQALYTLYGHLSQIDVAEGQRIETGEPLGLVGETGRVTGPHLHFEVRLGENNYFSSRNPELWMTPPIGWGVLAGRVMDTAGLLLEEPQLFIITARANRQNFMALTYGVGPVNSDPYYRENLVIGDLPAGLYDLRTSYGGQSYQIPIEIRPGVVNYFTFRGFRGFDVQPPALPGADFDPQVSVVP